MPTSDELRQAAVNEHWLRSIGAESLHPDEPWIGWADDWGHLLVWDAVQNTWSIRGNSIWEEHNATREDVVRLMLSLSPDSLLLNPR